MERTNVTDKGYTFNNQNFANETRTDSQGNNYTVAIPTAISSSSLTPQTPINVTQPVYNTNGQQTQANTASAYTNSAFADAENLQKQNEITQRNELSFANSDLGQLQREVGGKGTDLVSAYNQQDASGNSVNSLAGKLRTLSARSQALGIDNLAKGQAEINKATGQNITSTAVQRNTADVTRENLINQASIAMESAILKADYDTAKSYADQMVDAKYDQKLADIEAAKTNIDNIKENLTATEKKRAEATTQRLEKEKQDYEKKIAEEKTIEKLMIDASAVAPADVLQRAKDIQAKGGTATQVAMALGQFGGDYLKNEAYKSQLLTDKAQRANIYSQIAERNTEAIKKNNLANFQAPPIVNAQTGKVDPKSAIASIIKSTGGKLKGGQAALDVLTSVQALADRNTQGTFAGIGFGSGLKPERFQSQTEMSNRQDIEAVGLKVQQWASGASLTKEQTEMVEKFTPQLGDSDNAVKTKVNGLVNFMMSQVSADLAGQGINYSPEPIDMFSGIRSVDNSTFLGSIPTAPKDTTKLFDNKTFFDR